MLDVLGNNWLGWTITEKIGSGAFGTVYSAKKEDDGCIYESAIKVIHIPQDESEVRELKNSGMDYQSICGFYQNVKKNLRNEIIVMEALRTAGNIVSIDDYKEVPSEDGIGWTMYIRMEKLTSLSRYQETHLMQLDEIVNLGLDMCKALSCCEMKNIIHRDIKPDNVFVNEFGNFKLGDFGIARQLEKTQSVQSQKGTYQYMAPEVYRGESYNQTVDIYSLGIMLYRMLNDGRFPFAPASPQPLRPDDNERALSERMQGKKLPIPSVLKKFEKKAVNLHDTDMTDLSRFIDVVLKACSFQSTERYQNASEMGKDLQSCLIGKGYKTYIRKEFNESDDDSQDKSKAIAPYEEPPKKIKIGSMADSYKTTAFYKDERYEKSIQEDVGGILGIGFGSTKIISCVLDEGHFSFVADENGNKMLPTVAYITENDNWIIGEEASRKIIISPELTLTGINQLVETGEYFEFNGKIYSVSEIIAEIFIKIKNDSEMMIGHRIKKCVVAIPSCFGETERIILKQSLTTAGLQLTRFTKTIYAEGFSLILKMNVPGNKLICDFGSRYCDAGAYTIDEDNILEELFSVNDNSFGGYAWTKNLVDYIVNWFAEKYHVDLSNDEKAKARIIDEAERAKKSLNSQASYRVYLPCITKRNEEFLTLDLVITGEDFERINVKLINNVTKWLNKLKQHGKQEMNSNNFDEVFLYGENCHIPAIINTMKKIYDGSKIRFGQSEMAALGTAAIGGKLIGDMVTANIIGLETFPFSIIACCRGCDTTIIERNTLIPTKRETTITINNQNTENVEIVFFETQEGIDDDKHKKKKKNKNASNKLSDKNRT
jgi:molecular chaperone DnaK (HSP70)